MEALKNIPILDTPAKCAALWPEYEKPVIALFATGSPTQTVDVLWRLRSELLKRGLPVIYLFRGSARPMLEKVLSESDGEPPSGIYQLDNTRLFRFLPFVEVLVSNDYNIVMHDLRHIGAKTVSMPHHAGVLSPTFWNRSWDYIVGEKDYFSSLPYEVFPDQLKIHRNRHLTLLNAGHPKLDLLLEERRKAARHTHPPILLMFLTGTDYTLERKKISFNDYAEMWIKIAQDFLEWQPDGLVVYRPIAMDRKHDFHRHMRDIFANEARFFIDEDDNNKFWLARADYFVSCESDGYINFCLTARRPAIRLLTSCAETHVRDEWGWEVKEADWVIPLLQEAEKDKVGWEKRLGELQKKEMPNLGNNFELLAEMLEKIYNNDDDPSWPRRNKGHSPCEKPGSDLQYIARMLNSKVIELHQAYSDACEMEVVLSATDSRKWLLLLKHSLMASSMNVQRLDIIIRELLEKAEFNQPFERVVGVIRHCFRKDPETVSIALLAAAASARITGFQKKRALFFFLMECPELKEASGKLAELAQERPDVYSLNVTAKLNRFLPLAMRLPISVRRFGAKILGIKHPLAKKYWQAHCKLSKHPVQ